MNHGIKRPLIFFHRCSLKVCGCLWTYPERKKKKERNTGVYNLCNIAVLLSRCEIMTSMIHMYFPISTHSIRFFIISIHSHSVRHSRYIGVQRKTPKTYLNEKASGAAIIKVPHNASAGTSGRALRPFFCDSRENKA